MSEPDSDGYMHDIIRLIFLLQAIGATVAGVISVSQGHVIGWWALGWAIVSWWGAFLVWYSLGAFQRLTDYLDRRKPTYPQLTRENIAAVMRQAERTLCPPVGAGCLGLPWSLPEARRTCTRKGLCKIGGIMFVDENKRLPVWVWLDANTGGWQVQEQIRT